MPIKPRYHKEPISNVRKAYIARLVLRCLVLVFVVLLAFFRPQEFDILNGFNFIKRFSILHILWAIWVIDMFFQIVPIKHVLPLGSQKLFKIRFKPIRKAINYKALKEHIKKTTAEAYKVFILWAALIAVIGFLAYFDILSSTHLFIISCIFYVCDLICVLIWCPFRVMMKTRCCTTCRIFNWDHLMMFSPMLFILGVYSLSLAGLAIVVWAVWELCVLIYPERFWEQTNESLQCSSCTDKLCTQYCPHKKK